MVLLFYIRQLQSLDEIMASLDLGGSKVTPYVDQLILIVLPFLQPKRTDALIFIPMLISDFLVDGTNCIIYVSIVQAWSRPFVERCSCFDGKHPLLDFGTSSTQRHQSIQTISNDLYSLSNPPCTSQINIII